jgi:phosphoribosyl-ATP pyrophosphohydrolase/phosphoribosyl-AMP cyclohydrolase
VTLDIESLNFSKSNGLVTVVTQDATTGVVLMIAHADRQALEKTIETGEMHYTSRTRGLWHKGETSGNIQRVVSLTADCDSDSVLARVIVDGPACHTGSTSCFASAISDVVDELDAIVADRGAATSAQPGYTGRLLGDRNLRLKKIGEEAAELVVACADNDVERVREEAADLLYHVLVALRAAGVSFGDVRQTLRERRADQQPTGS